MKAIFRIGLAYFGIVALQEWLSILGALLLFAAMLISVLAKMPNAIPAVAGFGFTGVALLVFVPVMMGGAALRHASSRSMLYVRPNGRLRMLAGATLAITTLATLIVLPLLVISLLYQHAGTAPHRPLIPPATLFALCWSGIALIWISVFAITSSAVLSYFAMFLPLFAVKTANYLRLDAPDPLSALAFGVAAWGAFALWYMKAGAIRSPRWYTARADQTCDTTPLATLLSRLDWSRGPASQQRAVNQLLLGMPSPIRYGFVIAMWVLLILGIMYVINPKSRSMLVEMPGFPLLMTAVMSGTMAYMATRRARMLWLRAGIDRAGLFAAAERNGLASALLSMAILIGIVAVIALHRRPDLTTELLMFAGSQLAVCICAFYGGMALTHDWNAEDVLLCIGLGLLFMVEIVVTRPTPGNSPVALTTMTAIHAVAAILLRFYARRGWLKLDWRVAKMPRPFNAR
jgi:hypothetical protein